MQCDVLGRGLKQLPHQRLSHPDRLLLEPALDARPPIRRLVQNDLGVGFGVRLHSSALRHSGTKDLIHLNAKRASCHSAIRTQPSALELAARRPRGQRLRRPQLTPTMKIESALKNLDNPIQSFEEDLLQRRGFVQLLCRIFGAASSDESTVFALHGEWGSGKTSVKNLLKKELTAKGDKAPIPIEFNPWAFSGQDQVLEAFFSEVGKTLGQKSDAKDAAEGFKKLGAYLSFGAKTVKTIHVGMDLFGVPGAKLVGMVGETLETGSKDTKDYGEQIDTLSQTSLEKVQKDLRDALAKFDRPLLIIIDDLDRLTPDQLLTIFQIVKLNANLPRVNYLLLMDPASIGQRLSEKGLGTEFVEKIVQFELALPHVPAEELKAILKKGFETVLGKYAGQIDWERWEDTWTNGCQNIFTTLRRIKRFLHTLKFHVSVFANDDVLEVDPVDLFVVETIRKFAPNVHAEIPRRVRPIVCPDPVGFGLWLLQHSDKKQEFGKEEMAALIELAPKAFRQEVEQLLKKLFPQIGRGYDSEDQENQWIRDARACHRLFFDSYFRLAIPREQPTQQEIGALFDALTQKDNAVKALRKFCEKHSLHTLLARIQCHRNRLKAEHIPVLLSQIWVMDEEAANAAGIEKSSDMRFSTEAMSRFLLKNHCDAGNRVKIALGAMADSKTIYPLARLVANETGELKKNPHSTSAAFSITELDELQTLLVRRIHEFATAERLLDSPDSGVLLFLWERLESQQAVREWIKSQIDAPTKLPFVLSRFVNRGEVSNHRGTKVIYSISRKVLERFLELNEQLEASLNAIDVSKLSHWERFAVEETLKRIDEKRRGVQEPDYFDVEP